jgi:hypothetical protein
VARKPKNVKEKLRHNILIPDWIEKIQLNIDKYRELEDPTSEEKLEFITHQYHLVMLIHRTINGHVIMTGAKPI